MPSPAAKRRSRARLRCRQSFTTMVTMPKATIGGDEKKTAMRSTALWFAQRPLSWGHARNRALDADNVSVSGRTTASRGRTPRPRGARSHGVQGGGLLPNGSKASADRRGYGVGDHRYGPSKQYRDRPS